MGARSLSVSLFIENSIYSKFKKKLKEEQGMDALGREAGITSCLVVGLIWLRHKYVTTSSTYYTYIHHPPVTPVA